MSTPLREHTTVPILSVSDVNQLVRSTLEAALADCWVGGEISGFRKPVSGHYYFTLKDDRSQLACVMFRTANRGLAFAPEDGMQVIVHGRLGLYEARGALQLYVDRMEPQGLGAQQLALDQLKRRLAAEGLLAAARKRPLPFLPGAVGIATALRGAAIHDMLTVIRGRFPSVRVIVRPVRVQGSEAAPDIAAAIHELGSVATVGVIIVGRGGGSTEDLWAFNDERVARAIVASRVPVVSAVGHEIDFTVADLVADVRAPTPTAAAAVVVPERAALEARVAQLDGALLAAIRRRITAERRRVDAQARQLRDPRQVLRAMQQRVDELGERALRALQARLRYAAQHLGGAAARLNALSPLGVLERGYCIAQTSAGAVVRSAATLAAGELLELRFASGRATARVEGTSPQDSRGRGLA